MGKVGRILAAVLVAMFTAGTAMHAAAATDMILKMSMSATDEGGMEDCQDCPDDDAACDQFCLTALFAVTVHTAAQPAPPADEALSPPPAFPLGITGPPNRHPPRTIRIG